MTAPSVPVPPPAAEQPAPRPIALVTGGSRGIGRAVVERLAQDGHDIAFCYRSDEAAAERTADLARAHGARVLTRRLDVADRAAAEEFVAEVTADLGPPDALVASAGVLRDRPAALMSGAEWDTVLRTNLDGTFNVCRPALLPMIKRGRGAIVTLSSVVGLTGNATQANYAASKAGLVGLTKALAKEVGPHGVRVNAVAPGLIATDMSAGLSTKREQELLRRIPMGRFGTAHEVADLVAFLVSPRAAYLTGEVLRIDGGIAL
ncbi:3-oxoacyl-ACP reductase FabG [Kitasatospora sp. NPDC096140]|uniref:3-oxoacyl-ACP reductase FabG n=1 Tax=unclassified Kitasatospora TaxID=2633591 RepID=UPI003326C99D